MIMNELRKKILIRIKFFKKQNELFNNCNGEIVELEWVLSEIDKIYQRLWRK